MNIDHAAAARALTNSAVARRGLADALEEVGIKPTEDVTSDIELLIRRRHIETQVKLSELYVELAGGPDEADSAELTRVLTVAFPHHNVGRRHGPHYVSRIRTGYVSPQHRRALGLPPAGDED